MNITGYYLRSKVRKVIGIIERDVNSKNINYICTDALGYYINTEGARRYLKYYLCTISSTDRLHGERFFHEFKRMYSLQGIDTAYLDMLEREKRTIVKLYTQGKHFKIYQTFFSEARLHYQGREVFRELGSLYAKLMSTLGPEKYTALDRPIKEYFKLESESFIVAYGVINEAYITFIEANRVLLQRICKRFSTFAGRHSIDVSFMSPMKLLDLFFWFKANIDT